MHRKHKSQPAGSLAHGKRACHLLLSPIQAWRRRAKRAAGKFPLESSARSINFGGCHFACWRRQRFVPEAQSSSSSWCSSQPPPQGHGPKSRGQMLRNEPQTWVRPVDGSLPKRAAANSLFGSWASARTGPERKRHHSLLLPLQARHLLPGWWSPAHSSPVALPADRSRRIIPRDRPPGSLRSGNRVPLARAATCCSRSAAANLEASRRRPNQSAGGSSGADSRPTTCLHLLSNFHPPRRPNPAPRLDPARPGPARLEPPTRESARPATSQLNVSQNQFIETEQKTIETEGNVLAFRFLLERDANRLEPRFQVVLTAFQTLGKFARARPGRPPPTKPAQTQAQPQVQPD